jgi:hypothetical protein
LPEPNAKPPAKIRGGFFIAVSPSRIGREVRMWKEWLARTLSPRRGDDADGAPLPERKRRFAALPDLEGDGLHPGADEFRAALDRLEAEVD